MIIYIIGFIAVAIGIPYLVGRFQPFTVDLHDPFEVALAGMLLLMASLFWPITVMALVVTLAARWCFKHGQKARK